MGQIVLPPESPLVRAMRGWPTAPGVKPQQEASVNWANNQTSGLKVFALQGNDKNLVNGKALVYNAVGTAVTPKGLAWKTTAASSSYIDIETLPSNITECTLGVVFRNGGTLGFPATCRSAFNTQGIEIYQPSTTQIQARAGTSENANDNTAPYTVSSSEIIHATVTWRTVGSLFLYVDGIYQGLSGGLFGTITPSQNLMVARRDTFYMSADVLCVYFYDRKLSPSEVLNLNSDIYSLIKPAQNDPLFIGSVSGASGYTLTADAGAYTVTGTDAALTSGRKLTADAATYTLTGTDATLTKSRTLTAEAGTYMVAGTDATLTAARLVTAESAAVTVTGTDATLTAARKLIAESAIYLETGTAGTLLAGRSLTAEAATYALTGTDATLTYSASAAPVLSAPVFSNVQRTTATVGCTVTF